MSDCGPINPLQKVANHISLDRSLQQDNLSGPSSNRNHNQQISSLGQSHQLDLEFQKHTNSTQFHLQNSFNQNHSHAIAIGDKSQIFHQQPSLQSTPGGWANDFAKLSLNAKARPKLRQTPQMKWNEQSLDSQRLSSQPIQQRHDQSFSSAAFNPSIINGPRMLLNQTNTLQNQGIMTEHQELHHLEHIQSALDEQFFELERQLHLKPVPKPPKKDQNEEISKKQNLQFQQTARDISNVMESHVSQQTEKFKKSQFLKLMQSISVGDVELNEDETKLINKDGEDIHEANESFLPDPLEGLNAEDLKSPFEAAQKVSVHHNDEPYNWDEAYEDYRNDDTSF
ncbi:hypothetical protein WICMUC_002022 [Wickerhamomyces mucosus]|uniref:PEX18/PEX21 C-terminal domain-containing protein n=1 Tax=Wickerhamomyces mucosus TaxID=1378264 RepID=A0A9P8PQJ5_9ASCO|nr:hypothetical protein WICMUC_002022 [Wickerhamomyces mucosus]